MLLQHVVIPCSKSMDNVPEVIFTTESEMTNKKLRSIIGYHINLNPTKFSKQNTNFIADINQKITHISFKSEIMKIYRP